MSNKYKISRQLAESVMSIKMIDLVESEVSEVSFKNGTVVAFRDDHAIISGVPLIDLMNDQMTLESTADSQWVTIATSNPVIALHVLGFFIGDVSARVCEVLSDIGEFAQDETIYVFKNNVSIEILNNTFRMAIREDQADLIRVELCR